MKRTHCVLAVCAATFLVAVGCSSEEPLTPEERARQERRPVPTEPVAPPGIGDGQGVQMDQSDSGS